MLRGEQDLDRPKGDVDLLVADRDLPVVRRLLVADGFVEERSWGLTPHRPFLGFDRGTGMWLKLDVVTELAYGRHGEFHLPDAGAVLARRRSVGVLRVSAPKDSFWLLILHALLDKGAVDADRPRLAALAPGADGADGREGIAAFIDQLQAGPWGAEALVDAAARSDGAALDDAARAIRLAWRRKAPIRSAVVVAWRSITRRVGWRLGLIPRGVTVAILGPDGAGKSTLIETLRSGFPVQARGIYMGLYKRRVRLLPGVGLIGRTMLQFARYLRGRYHRARGRVVLFDRYTFDALVQEHDAPGWKTKIHTGLLAHAAPPPDLTLVLDLPGESLHARKGERDPATLERMRRGYLAIAARPGVELLDASDPPDVVARNATALIWGAIAARRGRRG